LLLSNAYKSFSELRLVVVFLRPKVAIVDLAQGVEESFESALNLVGGVDCWNSIENPVVVKVGVFNAYMHFPGSSSLNQRILLLSFVKDFSLVFRL